MTKRGIQSIAVVIAIVALPLACKGRFGRAGTSAETQTIAPAPAQPAETGTDAMTQTVELQEDPASETPVRSQAEGEEVSTTSPRVRTRPTGATSTAPPVTGTRGGTAPPTATTRTQ